jgi:hypothetical protein
MEPGHAAIERLLRIQPRTRGYEIGWSSLALVYEYLRQVIEWSELSGRSIGTDVREIVFADLAGLLLPELVLAPPLIRELEQVELPGKLGFIANNFVRWQAASEHPALANSSLRDPYEPLIRLSERGGTLFTHHGYVHVEHSFSLLPGPLNDFARLPPLFDMHDGALDKIDRNRTGFPYGTISTDT